MKKFWIKKGLMMVTFFIAAILLFGAVVMGLWNTILTVVLGVKAISFAQALGILLLSKILFGGFHGRSFRGGNGAPMWNQKMKEKCNAMTPEERERFKSEWRNRCGSRWRRNAEPNVSGNVNVTEE